MAMPFARILGDVDRDNMTVTVQDRHYKHGPSKGEPFSESLMNLNGAESFKACAAVGLNPKDYGSREARLSAVINRLGGGYDWTPNNGTFGISTNPYDGCPTCQGEPVGMTCPTCRTEPERTDTASDIVEAVREASSGQSEASSDAQALADLLRKLAGNTVSESDVRAIVGPMFDTFRDEVLAEASRPQVVEVTIAEREPVTLTDRQHAVFPDVLRALGAGLHVYLVGPPGTGKSTIAHKCADALGLRFGSLSCYATMTATALFGYMDATGNYVSTEFRRCYEQGGVFLLDEIDNGNPNVLAAINQALANGTCAFPDGMVKRHDDFAMVAAANTYGTGATRQFIGRNALDAATLDRFVKVTVGIDETLEEELTCAESSEYGTAWLSRVREYRRNVERHGLQVVISPRASIEGARMLRAGFTVDQVEDMRIFGGLAADQVPKIRG